MLIVIEAATGRELEQQTDTTLRLHAGTLGLKVEDLDIRMAQSHDPLGIKLSLWVTKKQ